MRRNALAFLFFLATLLSGRSQIDTALLFSDKAGLYLSRLDGKERRQARAFIEQQEGTYKATGQDSMYLQFWLLSRQLALELDGKAANAEKLKEIVRFGRYNSVPDSIQRWYTKRVENRFLWIKKLNCRQLAAYYLSQGEYDSTLYYADRYYYDFRTRIFCGNERFDNFYNHRTFLIKAYAGKNEVDSTLKYAAHIVLNDNAIGWISEGEGLELSGIVARMLHRNLSREVVERAVRKAAGNSRLDNHLRDWKVIVPLFGWEFSFFDQSIGQGLGDLDEAGQLQLKAAYLAALRDAPFIRALLSGRSPALFPILVEGKWGYIDKKGDVILSPRYRAAGRFAEGLAPVRSRGTYGYIGPGGQFIIEPRFDYAEPFEDGIARVYLEGKPYFINRFGQVLFEHPFQEVEAFGPHSYAIVKTASGKHGLINREGRLLADTVFQSIMPFSDGRAVVRGLQHNPYPGLGEEPVWEVGAIDTSGALVVPYGRYREISYFNDGLAIAELPPEEKNKQGVIDGGGNLKFTIPANEWRLYYRIKTYSEGLADVKIYLIDPDSLRTWPRPERISYVGAVNTNGQVVFSNEDWEELTLFGRGRAFAKDIGGFWIMIDKQGRQVGTDTYEYIVYSNWAAEPQELFEDGITFVKTREGWNCIDTSGAVVAGPLKYVNEGGSAVRQGKRLLFFRRDTTTGNGYLFGFWDPERGVLVEPQFHKLTTLPPYEDVLLAMESGRYGYISEQGRYLWREPPRDGNASLLPFNIDYMNLGLYRASLPSQEEPAGRGGEGSYRNVFQEATRRQGFQSGIISLVARPQERAPWDETYEGFRLYLANTTQDTVFFETPYSCLYLKIQALDEEGEWRDIEYLPDSWCSYTYSTAFLPPGHFWAFTAPAYSGEYATRLRAELQYWDSFDEEKPKILHSNEFRGGVNPAQFWRKRPLTPTWIMDPYDN